MIGPNGAGKSTLLLHLNGILRGSGSVTVFGLPVEPKNLREVRRRVGVVFQDPEDQLFLTSVAQDVAFGPSNMGLDRDDIAERVADALAAVGMEGSGERSSHHLSFGQKKRIAVATVLSMRPDVLVLDEPTSNLDPKSRRRLIDILSGLPVTKIVVTHDMTVAYELCERTRDPRSRGASSPTASPRKCWPTPRCYRRTTWSFLTVSCRPRSSEGVGIRQRRGGSGRSSGITSQRMRYRSTPNPAKKVMRTHITRMMVGSTPKYSASPPHTPAIIFSVRDLCSRFSTLSPLPRTPHGGPDRKGPRAYLSVRSASCSR